MQGAGTVRSNGYRYYAMPGLTHVGKLTGLSRLAAELWAIHRQRVSSALTGLTNLNRLDLVRTRTSDNGRSALLALKSLTTLNLDYTTVTDKGVPAQLALAESLGTASR